MNKFLEQINKVNYKKVITGFLLIVFILFLSLGITSFLNIKKVEKNNTLAEEITHKSLPSGFSALEFSKAGTYQKQERVALLSNRKGESVVLVEGPKLKLQRQKDDVLKNLQFALEKDTKKNFSNTVEILPGNNLFVEGKPFPGYNVNIKHKGQVTLGIATFLDYRKKTLCIIYLADKPDFNMDTIIEFLESLQLPD